jgi:hypothetical protein
VTQSDFFFTPRAVTTHTGDRLTISNVSPTSPHTFTIASKGIDVVNSPGQSKTITIKLSPGSYPFVCTYHQALGMTGTLIVSAPGTKPAPGAVAAAAAASPGAGSSPGAAGPSGAAPGSSPAAVGPAPQAAGGAAGGGAAGQAGGAFPLGILVIVGGLLALTAGAGTLAMNVRNRLRARGGG